MAFIVKGLNSAHHMTNGLFIVFIVHILSTHDTPTHNLTTNQLAHPNYNALNDVNYAYMLKIENHNHL